MKFFAWFYEKDLVAVMNYESQKSNGIKLVDNLKKTGFKAKEITKKEYEEFVSVNVG